MKIINVITGMQKASGVTTFVENIATVLSARGHSVVIAQQVDQFSSADVFHIHGIWSPLLHRAMTYAKARGIPIVWSTHGMTAPWSMRHKRWKKAIAWNLYQRRDLRNASVIHCTGLQEVSWNQGLGFDKCCVIPLGTNLPDLDLGVSEVEKHAGKTLLFVGRLYPVKAIDRLIMAFQSASFGNWTLRIVGPDQGGHLKDLKRIAGSKVVFVGPKFGSDLAAEYRNCDGLALVSHTENFGATVVDALAYGKPVITSKGTPWREVVDRSCGWWVKNDVDSLSEAISGLMRMTDGERKAMGERGRSLVQEKYTWNAVADMLVKTYCLVGRKDAPQGTGGVYEH